jgi:hypothetical protein
VLCGAIGIGRIEEEESGGATVPAGTVHGLRGRGPAARAVR